MFIPISPTLALKSSVTKRSRNGMSDFADVILPRPVRPYTVHDIIFQLERNFILQKNSKASATDPLQEINNHVPQRPKKYRKVIMRKNWNVAGTCEKWQKDHKIHVVISFIDLTQTVSKNWTAADNET